MRGLKTIFLPPTADGVMGALFASEDEKRPAFERK